MIRALVTTKIQSAIDTLVEAGRLPRVNYPAVIVEDTKQPEHGDLATNWAMVSIKALSSFPAVSNPRALGELLAEQLRLDTDFTKVDVAGPGFVNVTLKSSVLSVMVGEVRARSGGLVLEDSAHFARPSQSSQPQRINLEFVSVNPNGPITIGSGRGAAYGSTLANVLQVAGHDVHREYYINDGVNSEQMRLFAESVKAVCEDRPIPDNGYKGDYVAEVAKKMQFNDEPSLPVYDATTEASLLAGVIGTIVLEAERTGHDTVLLRPEGDGFEIVFRASDGDTVNGWLPAELGTAIVPALQNASHLPYSDAVSGRSATLTVHTLERDFPVSVDFSRWKSMQVVEIVTGRSLEWFQSGSQSLMLAKQSEDLSTFGVTFDTWFSEQSLHDSGKVQQHIDALTNAGVADENPERTKLKMGKGGVIEEVVREPQNAKMEEEEGDNPAGEVVGGEGQPEGTTLWLRSTLFGDDMDRVLRRKDGRLTYIASDVAYHADKFNRPANADRLITVLGPDHHGYINRLHAVVAAELLAESKAIGGGESGDWSSDQERDLYHDDLALRDKCIAARQLSDEKLTVQIFQLVRFMKDGKPAPMRKRDGNIYALIDLINEIGEKVRPNGTQEEKQNAGKDVARFFYLMRHHDTTFDFDLNLAEKQSDENPVFYVQYAHARICSVLEKATEAGITGADHEGEVHPRERALVLKIADLSYEVERCAQDYAVNRLTTYAIELARLFHAFYDSCRVVDLADKETSGWRVSLCEAARAALKASLDILGVEAPNRMERDVQAAD